MKKTNKRVPKIRCNIIYLGFVDLLIEIIFRIGHFFIYDLFTPKTYFPSWVDIEYERMKEHKENLARNKEEFEGRNYNHIKW